MTITQSSIIEILECMPVYTLEFILSLAGTLILTYSFHAISTVNPSG